MDNKKTPEIPLLPEKTMEEITSGISAFGIAPIAHDTFFSPVEVKEMGKKEVEMYEKEIREKIVLGLKITIPHYYSRSLGRVSSENEIKEKVTSASSREIHLLVGDNDIVYYHYPDGALKFKEGPYLYPIVGIMESLKYLAYKDSGFLTFLVGKNGSYVQAGGLLVAQSEW